MESEFGFDSAADKDWDAGMDSDSSSGKDPKVHGHYRRKKTNKAPRKRTFIANMTKYNGIETGCLASAARGVGSSASGGQAQGSAALAGGLQNFLGPPGTEEEAGAMDWLASFPPVPAELGGVDVGGAHFGADPALASGLPWELAALPNVGAPVVWGAKQVQASAGASTRAPTPLPPTDGFSFCALLNDVVDAPPTQQQQAARAAAAAAAASVAAYAPPSMGMSQPLPNAGAPKVSFDMFPELAALAAGNFEPAAAGPARALCFSRAVVTAVEERAAGFMPAPVAPAAVSRQVSLASAGSVLPLEAAHSVGAPTQPVGAENGNHASVRSSSSGGPLSTEGSGKEEGGVPASGSMQGSYPTSAGHLSSGSAASAQSLHTPAGPIMAQSSSAMAMGAAGAGLFAAQASMRFGAVPPTTAMAPHPLASFAIAAHQLQLQQAGLMAAAGGVGVTSPTAGNAALMPHGSASFSSAMSAAASVQLAQLAAAQQAANQQAAAAATAVRGNGRRGANGRTRGAARGASNRARALARSASVATLSAMGAAPNAALQQAQSAGNVVAAGAASSLGPHGERNAPFSVPLHGMSSAGAVVPGSAGELAVSRLISVGAYGVVYKARWSGSAAAGGGATGADVAVKVMRRPQASDGLREADVLRSFRHEASLLRRLAHPNIVALRHAQDVEPVCIVQDLAAHGTLADYIHAPTQPTAGSPYGPSPLTSISDLERAVLRRLARRVALHPDTLVADLEARSVASVVMGSPTPAADGSVPHANQRLVRRYVVLLCLLRDVAAALAYLAGPLPGAAGGCLVHRDVKPSNVLLSGTGSALLADFGVAKALPLPSPSAAAPLHGSATSLMTLPAAGAAMLAPSMHPSLAGPASPSAAPYNSVGSQWGGSSHLAPAASAPLPAAYSVMQQQARGGVVQAQENGGVMVGVGGKRGLPTFGSAPAPLAPSAVVAAFNEWSGSGAEEGRGAKRSRMESGAWSSVPDALPSWDADMSWLADLLADDEQQPGMGAANAAAAAAQQQQVAAAAAQALAQQQAMQQQVQMQQAQQQQQALSGMSSGRSSGSGAHSGSQAGSGGSPVGSGADSWPQHHGTAHYAAPEDLARDASPYALGPAADVFSLGYCIWEALTGQRPWSGSRAAAVADAVGRGDARLPLPACWPPRLRDLVARCWAADPALRPTPAEVGGVLEEEVRRVLARA